jgi:serine/threonine protein kinase
MREQPPRPLPTTVELGGVNTPQDDGQTASMPGRGAPSGYEIIGELGRGGMGVVYKAQQFGLRRIVALKMILAGDLAGPDQLARFRAEAEAIARFQHPNIVQIYEVGEHNGLPFFSLEFVDGGSLAEKLRRDGPFEPCQAAQFVEIIARAIQVAHERGIIHRDLKPANVLLTTQGSPKVSDFGLAKRLEEDAGLTQTGAVMGTPSYMAPEQAWGQTPEIRPVTDVYSLGAILYALLTGNPPFRGRTPHDTLEQVRHLEPTPPRKLRPGIPRDLETICLKSLQKDLAKRYPSAQALADDLGRFLNEEPISARPVPAWERAWKWVKKRRAVVASAGIAGLAVVVLTASLALLARNQGGNNVDGPNADAQPREDSTRSPDNASTRRTDTIQVDMGKLRIGQEPIPGYRLSEQLISYDLSHVYKADGPGGFPVALQFKPRAEGEHQQLLDKSLDLMKQIRHPYLLSIFGLWRTDKADIVAMELSDSTLEDRLRKARELGQSGIAQAELLRYMEDAAKGIDYLNEPHHTLLGKSGMSVVHGDVKPRHMRLVGGRVKIAEFLFAECVDPTRPDLGTRKDIRGTPAYMAPERVRGETSMRTDQYSLAATYYHLRTDRFLFPNVGPREMLQLRLRKRSGLGRVTRGRASDPDTSLVQRAETALA